MVDALHDLGCPVADRVLVLNVLRGLSSTYDHLRTWITRQRPFPSFLQVRDDLVLEEITRGPATGLSSSTALVAAPPDSSTSPATSLLGAPPTGQTGGRWGHAGRHRREGCGGGGTGGPASGAPGTGGGSARGPAPAPAPAPGGTPWPSFSNPWSGRISMWPFQGLGGLVLSSSRRSCSPVLPPYSHRLGPRPLSPASSRPGPGGGTRPHWRSPSAPWG